ncbi:flagellar hook-basal body complex protein FliE [Alkalihalophilus pseudofirmus]|uniref:flagellar hook-basal body complex protein FliE n=1 Tax=Alkalihalobacterium alkalinitrilicum TaxID=427920 RepID=UPI00094D41B4|nr:flagellar hook-basal body complex protein FliE [Alkalihalobacterium alkalinitrilicum]OLO40890.1 flagellar hook-basal body complex protein FliE [Alkalihalophilus pseudofirmus]
MELNKISSPFTIQRQPIETQVVKKTPAVAQNEFKAALSDAIKNVNAAQNESSEATLRLARGEADNLHEVMILGQKASITLQATVEVRNKVIEAYQEIMRMQV